MSESLLRFVVAATVLMSVGLLTTFLLKRRYGPTATTFLLRTTVVTVLLAAVWSFVPVPRWKTPMTMYPPAPYAASPTVLPDTPPTIISGTAQSTFITRPESAPFQPDRILTGLFWLGSGWNLASFLTGFVLLRRLRTNSYPVATSREEWETLQEMATALKVTAPELREIGAIATPVLAAVPQPVLFLPDALSYTSLELRAMFAHELKHLQHGDLSWFLLARILCALLWFHPLAYLLLRQLEHNAEEACDEASLQLGIAAREYANFLLRLSEQPQAVSAFTLGIAPFRSSVGRRIVRLLQVGSPDLQLSPRQKGLALFTAMAFLVVCVSLIGSANPGRAANASALSKNRNQDSVRVESGHPQTTPKLSSEEFHKRYGKPITLHVRDEEVVSVLKRLFEEAGLEYRMDPRIGGRVRVDFDRVPLKDAVRRLGRIATPRFGAMVWIPVVHVDLLPPTGSIAGRILYPDGRPAADVYLLVQLQNRVTAKGSELVTWGDTKTDNNGYYKVSELGPYKYNVAVSLSDFKKSDPMAGETEKFVASALEGVRVTPDKTSLLPDIRLTPGGIISGEVRDTAGNPVPRIGIGNNGPHRPESSAMVAWTMTDSSGRFQLRVPPGRSKIYINAPGFRPVEKYVEVREGETIDTTVTVEKESQSAP